MTALIDLLTFLTRPPGVWLYTLGLVVALEAPAALALNQWWGLRRLPFDDPDLQRRRAAFARLALAAGLLFALRGLGLIATLAIPAGSVDALVVLPPLERATALLTVVILAWAFAYPEPAARADWSTALLVAAALAALLFAWYWWVQGVALGASYFNGSIDETLWVVATLVLLLAGLWVVLSRRAPGWRAGAVLLGVLLIGHFVHYLYPVHGLDTPGAVRWAELVALPLAAAVLYWRALGWPPALSLPTAPPAVTAPHTAPPRPAVWPIARQVSETLLIAAVAYFAIEFATGRFRVEGPSMQPNLIAGQYILTDRLAYRLGPPQRGDVVVVRYRSEAEPGRSSGRDLIKRVVAVPGETVSIVGGAVRVNGEPLVEPYVLEAPGYSGHWQLGAGEYFVLGDNRNNSSDSHLWGPITREQITGKALLVYWPPGNWTVIRHYRFAILP